MNIPAYIDPALFGNEATALCPNDTTGAGFCELCARRTGTCPLNLQNRLTEAAKVASVPFDAVRKQIAKRLCSSLRVPREFVGCLPN